MRLFVGGLGWGVFRGEVGRALDGCFWFRRLCAGVTHPRPLSRGEVRDAAFLVGNERFVVWGISLLRGDQGVCYSEGSGLG